jgi:hypothetical protein
VEAVVYRHNRITRLNHWVNLLALLILLMSGLQIFNAYPNLHWGSKAEPDEAFFSIYATDEERKVRGFARFYDWRFETTGFLGVQNTEMGPFPRAFQAGSRFRVTSGLPAEEGGISFLPGYSS